MMAERSYSPGKETEDYQQVLQDFNDVSMLKRKSSRRHSTGSRPVSYSSREKDSERSSNRKERAMTADRVERSTAERSSSTKRISNRSYSKKSSAGSSNVSSGNTARRSVSKSKSIQSEATTTSSDSELEDDDDSKPLDSSMNVRNRALIHENRRLNALVADYQRRLNIADGLNSESQGTERTLNSESQPGERTPNSASKNGASILLPDDEEGLSSEEIINKLKGKIRGLKSKRKHEKLTMIQMEKNVEAHTMEIEGLQRELNRTLTELEKEQKGRLEEKHRYNSVSKQLAEARSKLNKAVSSEVVEKLRADLKKRDGELEVTLELLQSKVERIIQLEYELEKSNEMLAKTERRVDDLMKSSNQGGSFQSMELISAEAEIKSIRRQNMMLKLVVEELQEARKRRSDSDIDIDSVFLKLPPEIQQEIPFSVGLGALSFAGDNGDAGSVETDMYSIDTSKLSMSEFLPKRDPNHPLRK